MWADAKPDGTRPNNWLSTFGEVEWRWDTRRNPYFLHNFLTSQPDLNVQDPVGIEFWPDESGHNGCRTPMPWDSSVQADSALP